MKNPVQTFKANHKGRDFVIGDLHGSFSILLNLLKNIDFDPAKDRMFSVGDLVDRGPESRECLDLLLEPWFHSVLANHEQMMLEAFAGGYLGQYWTRNGGSWGVPYLSEYRAGKNEQRELSDDAKRFLELLKTVEQLPYLMTVKLRNGRQVHIIHAEFPQLCDAQVTDELLADPDSVSELAKIQSYEGEFILWGRYKFRQFYRADVSNREKVIRTVAYDFKNYTKNTELSHVVSGHTIVQRPMTILGQTNIDTCACNAYQDPNAYDEPPKWCALTCIELNSWTFYQATETTFKTVEPLVVNSADLAKLRSKNEADSGS